MTLRTLSTAQGIALQLTFVRICGAIMSPWPGSQRTMRFEISSEIRKLVSMSIDTGYVRDANGCRLAMARSAIREGKAVT